MDHESLRTASTYLNNLLLARGLLRNSTNIDFVKPSKESRAQIINLVHDLILREDRDRDQREHVAVTLRNLRADDKRKDHEIERLTTKCEENARTAVHAKTGERTAREEVKRVEKAMKTLQEQTGNLKTQLAQVRTQCQNDVKKRDLELARLKTHLQGQQRGNKGIVAAPSINITGGNARRAQAGSRDVGDPEYSLKQETTEFLTQLSQGLSDENDGLITLVKGALETMHEMLGLPQNGKHPDSAIGSMGSNEDPKSNGNGVMHAPPTSHDTLAADLDAALEQMKAILTSPDFVSLQEVEERDEEIARLREGWVRMEQRWKEVLYLMDGWRRKMDTGHTINLDDLRQGMGLCSPDRMPASKKANGEDWQEPEQSFVNDDSAHNIALPDVDGPSDSSSVLERPQLSSPAKSRSGLTKRKRDLMDPPDFFDLRPSGTKPALTSPEHISTSDEFAADADPEEAEDEDNSLPQMTIAQKLDLAREEAEAAAATLQSKRNSRLPRPTSSAKSPSRPVSQAKQVDFGLGLDGAADEVVAERDDDTLGALGFSPVAKKTRIRGRPKRRKSTLSREEMEELVLAGTGEGSAD